MSQSDSEEDLDICNVFVKYLPHHYQDDDLHNLFKDYGTIQSVKVMLDPQSGTSLGYGFVRFEKPEEAQLAIDNLSRKKIEDRTLLCKLSNFSGKSVKVSVTPIPNQFTEESLKELFEVFGEIIECKINQDSNTGYIRFASRSAADDAILKLNGTKLKDEEEPLTLTITGANRTPETRRFPVIPPLVMNQPEYVVVPQPIPVPYMMNPMNPMGYNYQMMPPYGQPVGVPMPMHNMQPVLSPRTLAADFAYNMPPQFSVDEPNLFIFHLPPDIDDEGLTEMFTPFGQIESSKVIIDKATGDSKGYGFVQFVSRADAERALAAMNGKNLGTKRLSVSFKTPSPRNSPRNHSPRYPSPRYSPHN